MCTAMCIYDICLFQRYLSGSIIYELFSPLGGTDLPLKAATLADLCLRKIIFKLRNTTIVLTKKLFKCAVSFKHVLISFV
jgi:hypothetical protein